MTRKFYTRLDVRLTLTIAVTLFVVFAFSSYTLITVFTNSEIDKTKESCLFLSSLIIKNLEHFMLTRDLKGVESFFESISKSAEIHGANIMNGDGLIVFSTDKKAIGRHIPANILKEIKETEGVFLEDFKEKEKIFSVLRKIENKKQCFGCHKSNKKIIGILNINYTFKEAWLHLKDLRNAMILSAVVSMGFIAVVLYIFNNLFIYRRIHKFDRMVEKIRQGDLEVSDTFRIKDELGTLGDSFNAMVKSLKMTKKEVEEQHQKLLAQSEKLASIGQLASGIAHEIQNPLAGISGALKVIHSEMKEGESNKEILKMILEQVNRLSKTAGDLLSFARPSVPKKVTSNLNEIIEQTVFFVQQQAEVQGIEIKKDLNKNQLKASVDPELMKQVFLNIMLNGIQAMKKGGTLFISSKIRNSDSMIEINFTDTGMGIKEEDKRKIFNPFFTTKHKGTGLGLYIVKNIVESHNGELRVNSEPGKGTTFTILLPV